MMKILIATIVILALSGTAYYFMTQRETETVRTTPIKIVAFGDSLTAGYGVSETENYPNLLKTALSAYPIEMINLGVNGDTTGDAKARVQQVIDEKPDLVILGIGGNDALRLLPVGEVKANMESIIEALRAQPAPPRILLLEMKAAVHGGLDYKKEFDAVYEDVAEKYDLPLVPFVITKIYLDQKYVLSDRIHMNGAGYAYVVKEYLKEAVEDEIRKLK